MMKKQVWTDFEDVTRGIESCAEGGGTPHVRVWFDGEDNIAILIVTSCSTIEANTAYSHDLDEHLNLANGRKLAEEILKVVGTYESTVP